MPGHRLHLKEFSPCHMNYTEGRRKRPQHREEYFSSVWGPHVLHGGVGGAEARSSGGAGPAPRRLGSSQQSGRTAKQKLPYSLSPCRRRMGPCAGHIAVTSRNPAWEAGVGRGSVRAALVCSTHHWPGSHVAREQREENRPASLPSTWGKCWADQSGALASAGWRGRQGSCSGLPEPPSSPGRVA